jgi:voltage-gated potassium channel
LVLSTIFIFIYGIKHPTPWYLQTYEVVAIMIFITEWLLRLWVSSDMHKIIINHHHESLLFADTTHLKKAFKDIVRTKLRFIVSPMSIIDLLAIIPSYRPLRFLRIFLIFRLFKLFRYTHGINPFLRVFAEKKFEFLTLLLLFAFIVFFTATIIYVYEGTGENPNINSFFDAVYWSLITISTVGYGDITPTTTEGKFATFLLILGGVTFIAFSTSIVTSALTQKLEVIKSNKALSSIQKMKSFLLICGFSHTAEVLCKELSKAGDEFVIIDAKEQPTAQHYNIIHDSPKNPSLLKELLIHSTHQQKTVAILSDSDILNLEVLFLIKNIDAQIQTQILANAKSSIKKFRVAGADTIIYKYENFNPIALGLLAESSAFTALNQLLSQRHDIVLEEIKIEAYSKYNHRTLKALNFKDRNITLIGILDRHRKFIFKPTGDHQVDSEDILIVMGRDHDITKHALEISQ